MIKQVWLYIKVLVFFLIIAIPLDHLIFYLLLFFTTQEFIILESIILLPISMIIGFIPAIFIAISNEKMRQSSENQSNYLIWVMIITLFIVMPYVLILFYHSKEYLLPRLLILSTLLATLITSHLWWKITALK